jgi:hypothetical protein
MQAVKSSMRDLVEYTKYVLIIFELNMIHGMISPRL